MVPPYSHKVSRVSWYSGYCQPAFGFTYEAFTLSGGLSQNPSVTVCRYLIQSEPLNARIQVWALSLSLAATQEIDVSFSSSGYLDVSVLRVCLDYAMYSRKRTAPLRTVGFPIRKSLDQSLLTAPQSISVLVPSFIDS